MATSIVESNKTSAADTPDEAIANAIDNATSWLEEWDASQPVIEDVSDAELELTHYVRVQNAIAAEMDRVEAQYKGIMRQLAAKKAWFESQYSGRAAVACKSLLKGKAKSVKTIYGTAGFRTVKPLLVVEDDVAVMDNVEAGKLPAEIVKMKVTHSIDKSALNKWFDETGEIPVGCTVAPEEERFYCK